MGSTSRTFMTGLVTVLLLAALLLLQACNRENEQSEACLLYTSPSPRD